MLNMNSNEIIIDKNSSSIQISNKISSTQRKCYNYMLKIAKNEFKQNKNARKFMISADELLLFFEMGKENYTYLKNELKVLNRTQVVYNILGKNKRSQESGAFTLISEFKYKQGMITYSFPSHIEEMILNPKMFGKINLIVIKSLRSRYSIALYELAEDYLNAQIPKMTIEKFRELMGIEKYQYSKFATLKKNVIDMAVDEINDRENIGFTITYELDKVGRTTTHIKFIVHKKENSNQTGEKEKNFYRWKNQIVKDYKDKPLCNNLTELKYFKWTLFFIDKNGFIGKEVEGDRKILEKEEAFKIWEFLFENPKKLEIVPLTQLDILRKDFRGKKIEQITTTVLGGRMVAILELKEFREENERFFIEIEQENGTRFCTEKSFDFEEILEMNFIEGSD
jgi:plasmid replication initiation protein